MKEILLTKNRWLKFVLLLCVWGVVGTLFTVQSYLYRINVGQQITFWDLYPSEVFFFLSWGLLTPLLVFSARKFRVGRSNWISRIGIHLLTAVGIALTQRFLYEFIVQHLKATAERPFSWERLTNNVIGFSDYGFFIYFIVVFIAHAVDYYKQMNQAQLNEAKLREELTNSQLHALKMQLQPHFLFNTLNTISVLIKDEPQKAEQMLALLSDLLRLTLQHTNTQEISLKEELKYLKLYLEIEQIRFGERLKIRIDADENTLDAKIPTLILQPLVENAIKHGIGERRGEGVIEIRSMRHHQNLNIVVKDNGNGLNALNNSHSTGIGLSNSRSRLQSLYGSASSISISNGDNGGAVVEILIPFHTESIS
ncbi:MAG: histidine kinase [Ignavibacteriae bacterium]|nr:histidine kinase [Ignavibacteriota bacterium]